ncbi:MAG: FecR domain-containing protein [Sphingomonas sp.]|nr:FecR domain-containing protein [Sphingomonas sp.]
MTEDKDSPPKRGQLREDAANWFAVMRGPEANERRSEFEAWLACGELHRAAYNKIAETFSLGKGLKSREVERPAPPSVDSEPLPPARTRPRLVVGAAVVALILGTIGIGSQLLGPSHSGNPGTSAELVEGDGQDRATQTAIPLSTPVGSGKTFVLTDGSTVALDSDSLVEVSISRDRRDLHLLRGRGRFTVAHDGRPFTVSAAGGTVTARGTVFDVAVDRHDAVIVRLLQGRIDVALPRRASRNAMSGEVTGMKAGEVLGFGPAPFPPAGEEEPGDEQWSERLRDVDRMRLADLLAEANRYATKPILLASSELADLRVSGTFRVHDTHKLADNLGDPLGLAVIERADSIVLARSCPTKFEGPCRPPS